MKKQVSLFLVIVIVAALSGVFGQAANRNIEETEGIEKTFTFEVFDAWRQDYESLRTPLVHEAEQAQEEAQEQVYIADDIENAEGIEKTFTFEVFDAWRKDYESLRVPLIREAQKEVYVAGDQVFIADKPVTNSEDRKHFPTLSPNGKKLAYVSRRDGQFDRFAIVDIAEQTTVFHELEIIIFSSVMYMEWLDDTRVAFTAHRNPSLNYYVLLDCESGDFTVCSGIDFSWDSATENLYYVLLRPHYTRNEGDDPDRIMRNEEDVLYETGPGEAILGGMGISADGDYVYFYTELPDPDADLDAPEAEFYVPGIVYLNIAHNDGEKLTVVHSVLWDAYMGKIKEGPSNTLMIDDGWKYFIYDISENEITGWEAKPEPEYIQAD